MPAAWSNIRTVPGGKVGSTGTWGWGCSGVGTVVAAAGLPSEARPTNMAAPTTATSTSREMPRIHGGRPPGASGAGNGNASGGRVGGASTGDDCTATPGPAGVATSDQLTPFHQRTMPSAPSGSGYQPGAGCAGPVTTSP